jgi:hypothetical protein
VSGRVAERILPEGVESIELELIQIVPSVTSIVSEFTLNDATAGCLNGPLSSDYVTELEPNKLGHTILSPEFLRESETTRRRKQIREVCANFMREIFPGFFAEEGELVAYPSVDFLSVEKTAVVELAVTQGPSFLNALAIEGYSDTFSDDARSVLLAWDRAMRPSSRGAALLITDSEPGDRPRLPGRIISTGNLFAAIALRDALIDVIHETGELRDALSPGEIQDFLPADASIRHVEMVLGSLSADLRPVITELEEAQYLDWIKEDLPGFAGLDQKFNNGQLSATLTTEIQFAAKNLGRAQRDLNQSVQTISALASARASRELTRSNRRLQITALAIAVASLIVAVVSLVTRH